MTREIKFRGKTAYGCSEWRYGNLTGAPTHPYIQEVNETSKDWYNFPRFEVSPNTIGQYTGLNDKNGKEIYEGDIIRTYGSKGDEIKHIVKYSDKEAMYCTKLIGADMLGGNITQHWLDEFEFEVIGNIYDNPELLKEE